MNAQEQWFNWISSNGCVTSYNDSWKWSWYNDGWSKKYGYEADGYACGNGYVKNYAKFSNGIFCAGTTTNTWFGQTSDGTVYWDKLIGTATAGYTWTYHDDKNANCSSLLHHGHIDHT